MVKNSQENIYKYHNKWSIYWEIRYNNLLIIKKLVTLIIISSKKYMYEC